MVRLSYLNPDVGFFFGCRLNLVALTAYTVRAGITTSELKKAKECKSAAEQEAWADQSWERWLAMPERKGVKPRLGLTWHPIFDWTASQVWEWCDTSIDELARRRQLWQADRFYEALDGWPSHWAYISGNTRLSCSLCVLASRADLINGAQLNQSTWSTLVDMEQRSGWGFRADFSLSDLSSSVEAMPPERVQKIYDVLREMDLVYLDKHWRLDGTQLTSLLKPGSTPAELAAQLSALS